MTDIKDNSTRVIVSNDQNTISKRYRHSQLTFLFIAFCIGCVLLINVFNRQYEYIIQQQSMIDRSIDQTSVNITGEIKALNLGLEGFIKDNIGLLGSIIDDKNNSLARGKLITEANKVFPSIFSIMLADDKGRGFYKNISEDTEEEAISGNEYLKQQNKYSGLFLDEDPSGYHFVLSSRVNIKPGSNTVLAIGLHPMHITKLLAANQLPRHRLILLNSNSKGLIEVTSTGTRQGLNDSYLSQADMQHITKSTNLKGTDWLLVDVAIDGYIEKHQQAIWIEVIWQQLLLIILSFLMSKRLKHSNKIIVQQHSELVKQSRETELQNIRLEKAQKIACLGYWDYDLLEDRLVFSENFRILLGLKFSDLSAMNFYHLIEPEDRNKVRYFLASSIVRKKTNQTEFTVTLNNNDKHVFFASVEIPGPDSGNTRYLNGVIQDITDQKEIERKSRAALNDKLEAEKANKSKSYFLANMSHEIRTPMNSIIGFAESILDATIPEENRKDATRTIIRNGYHLLKLINDILDLSKVEANKMEIESINTDVFSILRDVESLVRPQAIGKELTFEFIYDFPVPASITSDPLRLKQILINLCANAIKFTESGSIKIRIRYNEEMQKLYFDVIDTGRGMTKEQTTRVFHSFVQADASTTRKYGGTGLGLSLSLYLAENMGGGITVTSEMGNGSTFTLCIDAGNVNRGDLIVRRQDIPDTGNIQPFEIPAHKLMGKVLLAEDVPDNQVLFSMYIKKTGASVTVVENGKLALDCAMRDVYDLIFMDMQMPVMDGIRAVQELRKNGYNGPIVALTANAMAEDRNKCITAGFDDFVTKPIDRKQFFSVLERYLKPVSEKDINSLPIVSTILEKEPELADLVEQYIDKLPDENQKLEKLTQDVNWVELRKEVHNLKGCGGAYGFPLITEIAREMEKKIKNKNYDDLKKLLLKFNRLSERICLTHQKNKEAS